MIQKHFNRQMLCSDKFNLLFTVLCLIHLHLFQCATSEISVRILVFAKNLNSINTQNLNRYEINYPIQGTEGNSLI